MKSIRTDPSVHAREGDERIRTAVPVAPSDSVYDTADDLLRRVHERIGLGVDIQTFAGENVDFPVEIRWKRDYDGVWSDERWACGGNLAEALRNVLVHEDGADIEDEREARDA